MLAKIFLDEQKYYDALILKSGTAVIQDQVDPNNGYGVAKSRYEIVMIYPTSIKQWFQYTFGGLWN